MLYRTLEIDELIDLKGKGKDIINKIRALNPWPLAYVKIDNLERLAIKVAKEVRATKVDAELENMNSFERRIIHNKLTNFKGVATESVGVEPNRHVVIKSVDK